MCFPNPTLSSNRWLCVNVLSRISTLFVFVSNSPPHRFPPALHLATILWNSTKSTHRIQPTSMMRQLLTTQQSKDYTGTRTTRSHLNSAWTCTLRLSTISLPIIPYPLLSSLLHPTSLSPIRNHKCQTLDPQIVVTDIHRPKYNQSMFCAHTVTSTCTLPLSQST